RFRSELLQNFRGIFSSFRRLFRIVLCEKPVKIFRPRPVLLLQRALHSQRIHTQIRKCLSLVSRAALRRASFGGASSFRPHRLQLQPEFVLPGFPFLREIETEFLIVPTELLFHPLSSVNLEHHLRSRRIKLKRTRETQVD